MVYIFLSFQRALPLQVSKSLHSSSLYSVEEGFDLFSWPSDAFSDFFGFGGLRFASPAA